MNAGLSRAQCIATCLSATFTLLIVLMEQWPIAVIDGGLTAFLFWEWQTPLPVE